MTQWMCNKCGYQLKAETPPEKCPSCKTKCDFRDITCYTPECGTEQNIDPKLAASFRLRQIKEVKNNCKC